MALPSIFRWGRGSEVPVRHDPDPNPINALHTEMNRLFEDFSRSFGFGDLGIGWAGEGVSTFEPRVDVEETETELRVTAELPGMEEKDFELRLESDALVIRGEKREERSVERQGHTRRERLHGAFERRVWLPCEIQPDEVAAHYQQGVLTVTLPKTEEARRKAVTIPVKTG
jgi:HSP20 family protein